MVDDLVIPDDGAGVVDAVGEGVPAARVGERVWVHSANHDRPFGTSAERVCVPADHAVPLPDAATFADGACLGVPALTAHRCVHADGSVEGATVLVTGGAGAVGRYDLAGPCGISPVVDVAFGANLPLVDAVAAPNAVIATYGSDAEPFPRMPFYSSTRRGITIRTVLVFEMPRPALAAAVTDVTRLLTTGRLTHSVGGTYALDDVVRAHQAVEAGTRPGRVLLTV